MRIIDLDECPLMPEQVLDCVRLPGVTFLLHGGRIVARLEPADEIDCEDEVWPHAPEQIARGEAARQRFRDGQTIPDEEVKRRLGINE